MLTAILMASQLRGQSSSQPFAIPPTEFTTTIHKDSANGLVQLKIRTTWENSAGRKIANMRGTIALKTVAPVGNGMHEWASSLDSVAAHIQTFATCPDILFTQFECSNMAPPMPTEDHWVEWRIVLPADAGIGDVEASINGIVLVDLIEGLRRPAPADSQDIHLEVRTFPQPVGERLTLKCATNASVQLHYSLVNPVGETILEGPIVCPTMDVESQAWAPGIYILRCWEGQKMIHQVKLIKL